MQDPGDALKIEHETIERMLAALEGMAARMEKDTDVARDDLLDAMMVIVEFADRCHQTKEEDVLFPALAKASPRVGTDIGRRLTDEHRTVRRLMISIRDLVPRALHTRSGRQQLAKQIRAYVNGLREHMHIEESQLIPEMGRSFTAEERVRVAEELERVECEEVGRGMHDAYVAVINRLNKAYG